MRTLFSKVIIFGTLGLISQLTYTAGGNEVALRDLSLTNLQKISLDKFKHAMEPLLDHDYMKEEAFLIRWLRVANFDLEKAEGRLLKNLQWRQDLKMENIHKEDWSDFQSNYDYRLGYFDKYDQPIVTADFGSWDFRRASVSGQKDKLERFIYKLLDDVEIAVRKQQKAGKLVTRGQILIEMSGYNVIQHACGQCISLYVNLILAFDAHFPELFDKVVLINSPRVFEVLLGILKPVMTPATRDMLHVYGTQRSEWRNYLLEFINENELPIEYGGLAVH